jgi:hypothetical protein
LRIQSFSRATVTGNTLYSPGLLGGMINQTGATSGYQWSGNTYYGNVSVAEWLWSGREYTFAQWQQATGFGTNETAAVAPTSTQVFVRPNRYEPGRANIVIYNWAGAASVPVDLSGVLTPGDRYEVRNVQDFFGPPVASGTYAGGDISLPMIAVPPPTPIKGWGTVTVPITGPFFDVFVVLRPAPNSAQ